jgi:hypothetical protein
MTALDDKLHQVGAVVSMVEFLEQILQVIAIEGALTSSIKLIEGMSLLRKVLDQLPLPPLITLQILLVF